LSQVDRVAVVVGGASGIGWATAEGLAAEGYRVIVADLNADGAAEKAAELGAPHSSAGVDVTDEATVAALFEQAGPVDVVVNTAGFGRLRPDHRTRYGAISRGHRLLPIKGLP
jgi:NAD(P)-dependent dehydrogenase (short-subunit alcohol dehydrogenase family)